jgi:predicted ATPase
MTLNQYVIDASLKLDKVPPFDQYPFSLDAVRTLIKLTFHPKVTYIIGTIGSCKFTLLEAIAINLGFNAEGGNKNFQFGTRKSHSDLQQYLRVAKGVRRPRAGFFPRGESFFNVATEIEKLDAEPSPTLFETIPNSSSPPSLQSLWPIPTPQSTCAEKTESSRLKMLR